MTYREHFVEHLEEVLEELCQYQRCDNCSIGCLCEQHGKECIFKRLSFITLGEILDEEMDLL